MYKTLIEVLKELPNVAPNNAKKQIKLAFIEGEEAIKQNFKICDCTFTKEEIDEIYIRELSYYGETIRTSPVGAKILISLYKKGLLIMKKNAHVMEPSIAIIDYAARSESYKKDCAEEERIRHLIENPNEITEEKFSYRILDTVIYKQCGPGSHSLNIANIKVNKEVCTYKSNSGKTSDSEIKISWTGSDGKSYFLKKNSLYRGNRRSDPNRNWGLGRE